jgi:hypothetical protein
VFRLQQGVDLLQRQHLQPGSTQLHILLSCHRYVGFII